MVLPKIRCNFTEMSSGLTYGHNLTQAIFLARFSKYCTTLLNRLQYLETEREPHELWLVFMQVLHPEMSTLEKDQT